MRMLPLLVCSVIAACVVSPRPTEGCTIRGNAPPADVQLAQAACSRARQRFSASIGPPPAGTIILSDDQGLATWTEGSHWTLTWPTSSRMRAGTHGAPATTELVTRQWADVLPHEIGHIMLGAWLYSPGRDLAGDYATYLPDWVDEAVAIAMEPDSTRSFRLAQARRFTSPALRDVLSSPHPRRARGGAFSTSTVISRPCESACDRERPRDTRVITSRVFRDGRSRVDTTYLAGDYPLEADAVASFYTLSYALWAYVEARGGRPAIEGLLTRLRRSPADARAVAGLPGLPDSLTAMERDWHEWLAAEQRP